MIEHTLSQIARKEDLQINAFRPLPGGDINQVYYCNSSIGELVIKLNSRHQYPLIFAKEANGLEALRKGQAFKIPRVIANSEIDDLAYLLLEYLAPEPIKNWANFGVQLAKLHRQTSPRFGFATWNYIGSLQQFNDREDNAIDFFIRQRLEPQFVMAAEQGFLFKEKERLYKKMAQIIPDEKPALIHGDLWSGNYLHSSDGFALIDPASAYSLREMDLAMMQLFGGFPKAVFEAYEQQFPTAPNLAERIPLYQLYYILVHLNIFGSAYYGRAEEIIERYI